MKLFFMLVSCNRINYYKCCMYGARIVHFKQLHYIVCKLIEKNALYVWLKFFFLFFLIIVRILH